MGGETEFLKASNSFMKSVISSKDKSSSTRDVVISDGKRQIEAQVC